jgi:feruloyl-CoA synthase
MSNIRQLELGDLTTRLTYREDGSIILGAVAAIEDYPRTILDKLEYWAQNNPQQKFIAQRVSQLNFQWKSLTYSETLECVHRLASALEPYSLSVEKPLAILSGNSIEHALLGLASMYIGVPYAPISPQYSLATTNFSKIKQVLDLITPGMIFVDHADQYKEAIKASLPTDVVVICMTGDVEGYRCVRYSDLVATPVSDTIKIKFRTLQPDDIAKFLFSSGSTGSPKAIINTHRMLSSNQQMIVQAFPFLSSAPVLVDWLPWNHTFGGNHNLGIALYNGGTYYIDDGKPVPKAFLETVRNLKEIAPTVYFNVPKGFEMLVKHLREDEELRRIFFSKVHMHFYAGAGLSQPVWDALDEIALETCGERIMILTGLGCTETAPSALFTNRDGGFAGLIGLPLPGLQVKLKKVGLKFEICFKGGSVTPGYWRNPELTQKSFDDEGFFKSGDAVKFVDANDPQKGLMFDGRISEDFKLNTGTWVSAGPMRAQFLNHFGACVKDVVIVGRDYPSVGALVFPDIDFCRAHLLVKTPDPLSEKELLATEEVRCHFEKLLASFSSSATGSSNRIDRISLEHQPPSIDKHEITDKGSLNASAIQENRQEKIELMYSDSGSSTQDFILLG